MLKETRALVAQGLKNGKTVDQMKKDHLLAKFDDLGKGFIKTDAWMDVLYADLQLKPVNDPNYQKHGHADEK